MPRRSCIHLADLPLHIVQRGHNREACFFAEDDYHAYRHWLGEALKTSGCRLHAYVQMTNHVHLLLTPPAPDAVSQLIISLGRRYVQYINKTYRCTGTLLRKGVGFGLDCAMDREATACLRRARCDASRHKNSALAIRREALSQGA